MRSSVAVRVTFFFTFVSTPSASSKSLSDCSDKDLLDALGVETKVKKKATLSATEERIIAGFEDIQRFVEENERLPTPGEDNDIFERIYATRLLQIKKLPEAKSLLVDIDHQGLLANVESVSEEPGEYLNDEQLLAELGVNSDNSNDLTKLTHVKPRAEIRAAEEIASRTCLLYTSPSPRDS